MMKLSEAIRLGAMIRPQGFGSYLKDGKSCALRAAYEAVGAIVDIDSEVMLPNIPPEWLMGISGVEVLCPSSGCDLKYRYSTARTIIHLNDDHRWTREQIADWVETVEASLAPSSGPQDLSSFHPSGASTVEGSVAENCPLHSVEVLA